MLIVLLCVLAVGNLALGQSPVVTVSQGTMRGQILKSRDGRDFFSFTKIPYAKPPVGERRYMISEKGDKWTGTLDATQPIPSCYQSAVLPGQVNLGQEDCLYLNIFSPNLTERYPVIFDIHGGAFVGGSAGVFGSARFFMDEDVVFVGPNYRLGPLGFLSLEDNVVTGNMGLKDQALALEWVQQEISKFGGDPNLITVIGGSAGAASADIICSAPRTNGIIKACVSQSGVGLSPWVFMKPGVPRRMALNLARALGCNETGDVLKCLRSKPIEQVGDTSLMADKEDNAYLATPVLEPENAPGAILTKWPTGTNHNYPWIIGVVQDEGMVSTGDYEFHKKTQEETEKFINNFNQVLISTYNLENRTNDVQKLRERYFKNGIEPLVAIRNYFTEAFFVYPSLKSLSKHPGPTYFYKFNYTRGPELPIKTNVSAVQHGAEVPYFMETTSNNTDWPNQEDISLSKQLVKMWVNFARDHTPSSEGMIQWPQFQGKYYLDIQDSGVTISNWPEYQETLD
ncbi:esterase FE4, partial [Halyomorpha halys]|uniref:esterase FE4 n=1 Tax=Halyomorpha halys TaxID=286706 RepID=UPI0006D4FE88